MVFTKKAVKRHVSEIFITILLFLMKQGMFD